MKYVAMDIAAIFEGFSSLCPGFMHVIAMLLLLVLYIKAFLTFMGKTGFFNDLALGQGLCPFCPLKDVISYATSQLTQ